MPIQFLSLQGTGGTAVPYERRNAPYYLSSIALNPQDSLRLKRYEEQWRFFQGLQWMFQREDGEPLVTVNYCRTIVNKKADWLVGKGMVLEVPEALTQITKPILDEVWDYNLENVILRNMAVTGGVTGDCFVLLTYSPPSDAMRAVNPYTEGQIRIRLLGSHQVFPYWNPLNMDELLSVRIITEVGDFAPIQPGDDRRTPMTLGSIGVSRKRRYIEDIYPDRIVEGWDGADRTQRPNDLGEIPLVHIQNEPFPNEYYGLSDLDGIVDLQRELNEKVTDVSDIVNYHSAPVTIITGAKAKNLERGPKNMWSGFPENAKVFNLEMTSDLPASLKYIDLIRQMMMDTSNIPEGSLGRIQPVSNTSGVALQVEFQPLVECTERKKHPFEKGVEKINYFILRLWQLVTGTMFPVDICASCGGRIVQTTVPGRDGKPKIQKKCYLIDPQTLDFMTPDEVEINIKRKFSYGTETRLMKFGEAKKDFLKQSASFWDPAEKVDLQDKADDEHKLGRQIQQHHADTAAAVSEHAAASTDVDRAANAKPVKPGEQPPPPAPPTPAAPPQPGEAPLPPHLDKPPEVQPEQLAAHDMDIPEEPESIQITVRIWDANAKQFVEESLGILQVVPSGCKQPKYLSPYKTKCKLRTPVPRNKLEDANLYALLQKSGWVSRHWVQDRLDEEIDTPKVDKEISDDIPFLLAMQGLADPAGGVAQTPGSSPEGDAGNPPGASLPSAAKPPGGGTAPSPAKPAVPPNAAPGTKV